MGLTDGYKGIRVKWGDLEHKKTKKKKNTQVLRARDLVVEFDLIDVCESSRR